MRRLLLAVSTVALLAAPGAQAATRNPDANIVAGSYIVVYKSSVSTAGTATATDRREAALGFRHRHLYVRAIRGFSAKLSPSQVGALRADPDVALVSPDRRVRASAIVPLAPGEPVPPTGVRRVLAATTTTVRQASGVNVAVIDTGIDLSHPDLNAANGTNCIDPGSPADDGNGHGSHVAGTIAAKNNGSGVTGVAPGTKVYAVKALDDTGGGSWSSVICGIDWVTAHRTALDIRVANMSLGGSGEPVQPCSSTTDPVHLAICHSTAAGVNYVVSAGNDGVDFDFPSSPGVPAAFPQVLTVTAASDSDGRPGATGGPPACNPEEADDAAASFSNFALTDAAKAHTIAAPGICITSTWRGGGYDTISGTSMASPHMAGLVALCIDENGVDGACAAMNTAQVIAHMRADASTYNTTHTGYGINGDPLRPLVGRGYFGFLTRDPLPAAATVHASRAGSGTGTIASQPAGINCGSTCSASFATGTSVTLTAAPSTGSTFSGWSGACAGTVPTCTVSVAADILATANFTASSTGNLVANPSFETGLAGWGSSQGRLSRVAVSGAPDGGWVARATRASGTSYSVGDNEGTAPTVASVTAGSTYVASCHVRAANAQANGRPGRIVLRERVGSFGKVVKETAASLTLSTTFKRVSVAAVAVTTGNTMGLRCEQTSAVAGDAFDADLMTVALETNLVGNSSFEASLAGWGSYQGSLSRVAVSGAPGGGWVARAARVSGTSYSVGDNEGTAPTVASVTAGSTYVASCSVRAANAQANGRPGRIVLRERVGPFGTVVKDTAASFTFSTTFKRVSVAAVAVTTGNTIGLRCEQTSAVAGDAFDADLMTVANATTVGGAAAAGTLWTAASPNYKRASAILLGAPRELVSLQAYIDGKAATTGSQPVSGILYAGMASGPTTRIATTNAVTISAGQAAGWVRLDFATPVRLPAGTSWIGLHTGGTAAVLRIAAQALSGASRSNADSYADGASATFGSATTDAKSLSLYAVGSWTP